MKAGNDDKEDKKEMGRPSKIYNFMNMMEAIFKQLEDDKTISPNGSTFFLTDEQIIDSVNLSLPDEDQIHYSTFEKWKAKSLKGENVNSPVFKHFLRLIKKAEIQQKLALGAKLVAEGNNWTKWAWVLERKFDDMNLKHKAEFEEKKTVTFPNIRIRKVEKND